MIRISLQLITGLVLCGCTVNNFHSTVTTSSYDRRTTEQFINSVETFREQRAETPAQEVPAEEHEKIAEGNLKIRPSCGIYVPLPVPKPVKIDFKELDSAETSKEINAIALRNVKELHVQINTYAARQQKHYNDYVQRCAVK